MSARYRQLLLLPHLRIHNANALSSPFTIGFPAMTAWLGVVHAVQRELNRAGYPQLRLGGVAVACHACTLHTHRGVGDFVSSIIGTANPLDKSGNRSAFIEEARCHLDASLVIEYTGLDALELEAAREAIEELLHARLKIAGGDILGFEKLQAIPPIEANDETALRSLTRHLMPGHLMIERRDLMIEAMSEGQDALDALLDYLTVKHRYEPGEDDTPAWTRRRKTRGWIVPIATGFHGLTALGQAEHQRNPDTLHRFAESVVTLGEFVMPHRIRSLDAMLWHYRTDLEKNLYLCQQNTGKPDSF